MNHVTTKVKNASPASVNILLMTDFATVSEI